MDSAFIRNFAIIAHIDHGKSTLADRLLELTGSLTAREMQAQVLDSMDLERERGITIKAHDVREAMVNRVPPPKGSPDNRLQALVFDSWFDPYRGVIVLTRVFQGTLRKGERIRLYWNGTTFDAETLGVLTPKPVVIDELKAGEVGFIIANIKNVADTKIGDTITHDDNPAIEALPGFEEIKPMVFAGLYTVDSHE